MILTRLISLTNFGVASSALAFQVFVLYPWHHQLDDEFKSLKVEHLRLLSRLDRIAPPEVKPTAEVKPIAEAKPIAAAN